MKQPSLFPIAMKIVSQTIGQDLVSFQPILTGPSGMSKEEKERIESEIKQKNRDGKIDSLIEGTEYKEEKVEEHPDYKPGDSPLFYMDYTYNSPTHKKTRRSKKKKKDSSSFNI